MDKCLFLESLSHLRMSHSKNFGLCRPFLLSNVAMQCSELNNVEGARLEAVSLKSGRLRACRWPTEALTTLSPCLLVVPPYDKSLAVH